MDTSRSTSRTRSDRHRLAWSTFAVVAVSGLAVALVAADRSAGHGSAAVVAILGLCVVGVAAALLSSVLSPVPENAFRAAGRSTSGTGYAYGFGDGAGGGGGFDGGGCGDGGGSC